jgi:hypothetical protein
VLKANSQTDPVVEILRLAYRRGLAVQRAKEEKGYSNKPQSLQGDVLQVEREPAREIEEAQPARLSAQKAQPIIFPSE